MVKPSDGLLNDSANEELCYLPWDILFPMRIGLDHVWMNILAIVPMMFAIAITTILATEIFN